MLVDWLRDGKPDVTMAANGMLAGLVSVTAPVGAIETWAAIVIGAVGGVLVVLAVAFFDNRRIDDPVGAVSVHAVCGTWGTLSIALFARYDDAFLGREDRSEEHTSELQSLMRLSYAVFCLKTQKEKHMTNKAITL